MRAYVLTSGGPDSATLAFDLAQDVDVSCIFINFGQPYLERELEAARALSARLKSPLIELAVPQLSDNFVDCGQFGYVILREVIEATYGLAAAYVRMHGGNKLFHGTIAEDIDDLPGFTEFFVQYQKAIRCLPNAANFELKTPYLETRKADVFAIGRKLGVPFEATWSCLLPGEKHCGRCRACRRRREAFMKIQLPDPTEYAANDESG
ncbi:7-cyano-7-deazaguanine synthase [Bradyrhizobium sp. AUGA SZCCT0222]|uniref:7-cyano-7-deazaguanine synthase n=1 Tax=Bradyrhizobium sp. AUGA SZCCT0222 TaxID=2807668 RepID=UPI001BA8FFFD|nr:7-cyano-7-deazaguanine synthase [Bradyrhizobium sp. AUGA SZCCT0222]MBR1272179.1 7-cyano-7-deazaguanine synthase [Bradyrhizobium sp. AUGA SZCCT0222]